MVRAWEGHTQSLLLVNTQQCPASELLSDMTVLFTPRTSRVCLLHITLRPFLQSSHSRLNDSSLECVSVKYG